ncbi:hypothetical protein BH11PLA2_BH11PLA2_13170 [soil metagenome]
MLSDAYLLPSLLLAVLAFPLVACLGVRYAGRWFGEQAPRTFAAYAAAGHLILTVVFVYLGASTTERPTPLEATPGFETFEPFAVPGDPALKTGQASNVTTWNILTLKPAYDTHAETAIQFFVGIDGLNLFLIALTSLMTFLAVLVSWEQVKERATGFYAWLFLLQFAVLGAFLSFDLILFYVFFELTLVPCFFLIGQWGVGGGRRDAARKFFLYTLFGSVFTLVGMLGVVLQNPAPLHPITSERMSTATAEKLLPKAGAITFSIPQLMDNVYVWDEAYAAAAHRAHMLDDKSHSPESTKIAGDAARALSSRRTVTIWLFVALLAGFAVKVPIVPFHTWLPSAYAEAPLAVTMLLSAVLAKVGTYGILRIVIPLVPEAVVVYGLPVVGALGAAGIIYAAFCAYAQRDLKLLAAYSSVSHLGLLVLGLFACTAESLTGSVLHMVNHGLTAGAMFALLGFILDRYKTLDMNQFGGLYTRFPRYMFFVMLLSLAAVGLPGLNNFVSEMLILAGLFDPRNLAGAGFGLATCAAAGVFLGAWYTFTMIRRVFFGPVREPHGGEATHDLTGREYCTFGTLAALCLALGLYPQPVIDTVSADVDRIVNTVDAARSRLDPTHRSPADVRRSETPHEAHAATGEPTPKPAPKAKAAPKKAASKQVLPPAIPKK